MNPKKRVNSALVMCVFGLEQSKKGIFQTSFCLAYLSGLNLSFKKRCISSVRTSLAPTSASSGLALSLWTVVLTELKVEFALLLRH